MARLKNIKYLFLLMLLIPVLESKAQQNAMYTHYMFNTLAVNPAYAGSRNALTVTGLHRSQWIGFKGAPVTQTLTIHSPVYRDDIGIGFSVVNDKIGPTNSTNLSLDFSYHLELNDKGHKLAVGIKAGGNISGNELNTLKLDDVNDQSFAGAIQNRFLPNIGVGFYYYTKTWYAGISIPEVMENKLKYASSNIMVTDFEQRHFYLIGGTVVNLSEDWIIKPTSLLKITSGAPAELDLSGILTYKNKISGGLMYRTGDAAGLLFGYQLSPQLYAGYSFDFSFTNTTFKYNAGSHEIMLRYDFIFKEQEKIKSPRYF